MCFETTKSAKAKTAKIDIECWKFVNPDLTNAFSNHLKSTKNIGSIQYKIGTIMPKIKIKKDRIKHLDASTSYLINKGYHSFKEMPPVEEKRHWRLDDKEKTLIKKFIIPAGTRYYENETEYISETIMLVE